MDNSHAHLKSKIAVYYSKWIWSVFVLNFLEENVYFKLMIHNLNSYINVSLTISSLDSLFFIFIEYESNEVGEEISPSIVETERKTQTVRLDFIRISSNLSVFYLLNSFAQPLLFIQENAEGIHVYVLLVDFQRFAVGCLLRR